MSNWYLLYNGQRIGPMSAHTLVAYNPSADMLVWTEGMPQWQPIYSVPELMALLNGTSANDEPRYFNGVQAPVPPAPPYSGKDKMACGILAILLGGLGVQYFYLGKIGAGLLSILLEIVTCGIWSVIALVQGIMMITMSQQEFDHKYVFTDKTFPLF